MMRKPAVAGQFYHGNPTRLAQEVDQYMLHDAPRQKAIAIVSPHAGLMYSGHVAGAVYSRIVFPRTFILIGPNHTGLGPDFSIMPSGRWEIPTASFDIDNDLAVKIMTAFPRMREDSQAHQFEHSLEVQLPFIAHGAGECRILPITVMKASPADCAAAGKAIADAVKASAYDVVIVASTDLSHFEQDGVARKLDRLAVDAVLRLDPKGLYEVVVRERITMCGFIPTTIALHAALALGAQKAELVKYATSGEVSGDYDRVVGYAGVIIS